jgi:FAD/FMN-containing dehydrogenase
MVPKYGIDALEQALRGYLVRPTDPAYDDIRAVWNGVIDRRPAVIARCLGAADVIAAVTFAHDSGLPLSVRGGGHSVAGHSVCEGGVMIDLSLMRSVRVDPAERRAWVDPGARLGDLDAESQAFGLAVPAGVHSRTGVAGLTLGGGQGYLSRSFGLTIDNLLSADVVTATGELVRASEDSHPDLFWGLRGGGGNFGVVTSFEYHLHPVGPQVATAQVFHPAERAGEVLRFYRDFMAEAPDPVAVYALCIPVPPVEPFPKARHGQTAIALVGCHSGSLEEGRTALAPLAHFGDPMLCSLEPMPYRVLQSSFNGGAPDGQRFYWKSHYLRDLSDSAIDVIASHSEALPGPFSNWFLEPLGGAVARVDPQATAFPHRQAAFSFGISSGWTSPAQDAAAIAWTRAYHASMTPYASGGVYANYQDFDEADGAEAAFGGNVERLRAIKRRYDPDNLFRANRTLADQPATDS